MECIYDSVIGKVVGVTSTNEGLVEDIPVICRVPEPPLETLTTSSEAHVTAKVPKSYSVGLTEMLGYFAAIVPYVVSEAASHSPEELTVATNMSGISGFVS